MHQLSKKELILCAGLTLLLIPALLIHIGLPQLYGEEPRRAVVALEMMLRGNYIIPTIHGEPYFLKPPFYNWILAAIYQVTGNPSEFNTRMTTVISLLLLGLIIFITGKKYVSTSFGALSSLLFITASGNLFFNSLLAEIDMFYSLVTYSGLISLFHFQQKKKYIPLFLVVYFLGAIGFLIKGMPSLLYTGLSLLVLLVVSGEWNKLFHWAHAAGILLFVLIVGGYLFIYSRQGDVITFILNLSVESGKRFSGDTFLDYLKHFVLYPLDTLMNLLPASLLILFTFRKSFLQVIRKNSFMKFALLMLVIHFPIYWIPPGGRQRYIIMLYPFIIQIITYFFLLFSESDKKLSTVINRVITIALSLAAISCLAPIFMSNLDFIGGIIWISLAAFLSMLTILYIQIKFPGFSILAILLALVLLRFVFDLVVLPARSREGDSPVNKKAALDIVEIAKGKPLGIYQNTYFPMQSIFYLERERNEILPVYCEVEPGVFYITQKILLENYNTRKEIGKLHENPLNPNFNLFNRDELNIFSGYSYKTYMEFILHGREYLLIMPFHPHP